MAVFIGPFKEIVDLSDDGKLLLSKGSNVKLIGKGNFDGYVPSFKNMEINYINIILKNDGDSVIYTNKLCNNTSKSLKFGEIIREDISCFSEKFGEVDCGDVKYTMGVFKNNRVIMYGDKIKPHECIDFKLNVKYDLSNVYSENYGEITVKLGSLLFDVE